MEQPNSLLQFEFHFVLSVIFVVTPELLSDDLLLSPLR
jgi:hypothetical protein